MRYYTIDGPTDRYGRTPFTKHWLQDYPQCKEHLPVEFEGKIVYPRGQCFNARLEDHMREGDIKGNPPWLTLPRITSKGGET